MDNRAEAKAEGLAEGEAMGLVKGEAIGEAKSQRKIAKNLLEQGFGIEIVMSATGLTREEVEEIQKDL